MDETVRGVEVLGGSRWTAAELDQIASGSTEAPLEVNGGPAGHVVNVRAVSGRLLADLRGVPARLATLIRTGRFKQIGTEVYTDLCRGIRAVERERLLEVAQGAGIITPWEERSAAAEAARSQSPGGAGRSGLVI